MIAADELRKKFIEFFVSKDHKVLPNLPLVPQDDPTTLFISAGMQPLTPYLLGESHPLGKRLVSNQRSLRMDDLEEVGDTRHLTMFEMLGNWSLGDYFKKEALTWSFEFLVEWLELDPSRLYASVFKGDAVAPRDDESIAVWQEIFSRVNLANGIGERIFLYDRDKNWWEGGGANAPGGPDSEIFFDTGRPHNPSFGKKCHINCDCGRFIEIWNNVFMEYRKAGQGKYEPLAQKNVDTGLGFERVAAILEWLGGAIAQPDVFETSLFKPMVKALEKLSNQTYTDKKARRPMRIICDHLRAATFLVADGVYPSNVEQGYELRRLVRRAIRFARQINVHGAFVNQIADQVAAIYGQEYPHLRQNQQVVLEELLKEEKGFAQTLERGLKRLERLTAELIRSGSQQVSGQQAFDLYQTYGFPIEMTIELAQEKGLTVDTEAYEKALKKHQERSRVSGLKKFAGGLADHSPQAIRLHTATHLLHSALRRVLGEDVEQKGSNITAERLRFDFSHSQKLTGEEIQRIEKLVNQKIKENLPVTMEAMPLDQARQAGALAFFGRRYGEQVTVYSIGDFSKEVCGGPHVDNTGKLGHFKIVKQESLGRGARRIKAVLE